MTTKFVQDGNVLDYSNSLGSTIAADSVVVIGANGEAILGVALRDIPDGETGPLGINGVYSLPKVSAAVITQGETVNWDLSAGAFDDNQAVAASGDVSGVAAYAFESKGNGDTTLKVKLTGVPGTLTA